MELKTPLYDHHVKWNGKIVPFAGYLLPVQYEGGVIAEHTAVRSKAGLFDVSHMGELRFTGKDALKTLNYILTNDFTGMYDGQVRYSPMANQDGGCVDDLLVYRVNEDEYLVVVNASNKDKDAAWMSQHLLGDCVMTDESSETAQVALQGPNSKDIILKLVDLDVLPTKYYSFTKDVDVKGVKCLISRTGYTGEFGYEIYCANADAGKLWDLLMEAGAEFGLIPCGLGARDTLRLEAAMPLYGHELDDVTTPLEAGLDFAIKLDKEDFIGKRAMMAKLPLQKVRIGLEVTGRGIVREHQAIFVGDKQVGETTSGTHCPHLGKAVAMGYVAPEFAELGTEVEVDVRGRKVTAKVIALPFYKR